MTDLYKLSKPFPPVYVHGNPSGGGTYVKHHVVNQRLLMDLGRPFDFALVEILRGFVPGKKPNPQGESKRAREGTPDLEHAIVGAVCRLSVAIDGQAVTIEEVGDCEEPHNWPHDGARMKDAMSDAFKRCAMRVGLGLHLWSQDEFFLDVVLAKREQSGGAGAVDGDADRDPPAADKGATRRTQQRKEDAPTAANGQVQDASGNQPGASRDDQPAGGGRSTSAPTIGANERKRIMALCTERGISTADEDRADRLNRLGQMIGRVPLKSVNDVRLGDEYERLITALKELPKVQSQVAS